MAALLHELESLERVFLDKGPPFSRVQH